MVTFTEAMVKFIEPATAAANEHRDLSCRPASLLSWNVRFNCSLSSLKCGKHEVNSIFSVICIHFDVPYIIEGVTCENAGTYEHDMHAIVVGRAHAQCTLGWLRTTEHTRGFPVAVFLRRAVRTGLFVSVKITWWVLLARFSLVKFPSGSVNAWS